MHPILFYAYGIPVYSHPFFIGLGLMAAILVLISETRRLHMSSDQMYWIALGALAGGGLGARLSAVWHYAEGVASSAGPAAPFLAYLVSGGRSILGGLAGAYIGAHIAKRLIGYRGHTGNAFAPAVALGMAIGRIGCLLSEQVGTPTTLPWGVRLSPEAAARIQGCPSCVPGVPLHPSYAYEILFHLLAFGVLWWYRPKARVQGEMFKAYVFAYLIFRFLVEYVRGSPVLWLGLTRSQLFCIPSAVLLVWYFVARRNKQPYVLPTPSILGA